ncbi:hypothetical protein [Nonomuraea pusilla]|uniref:Uncharacterized protein n=1 Tax=Nonomuraea pusilla TaxID=46177 RepID=A0A1H7RVF8_9ACTN|nr:hypothetical protein [Nonomuraea pusilla]SEL64166.1 hypothetical protein SAMN05660976_02934 [Nonomuraea pusilla]
MIRRLCAAGAVVAAAAGAALLAAPAHADSWSDNWSGNSDSVQSGNLFGDVSAANRVVNGVGVNNVNGTAVTATDDSFVVMYVFD